MGHRGRVDTRGRRTGGAPGLTRTTGQAALASFRAWRARRQQVCDPVRCCGRPAAAGSIDDRRQQRRPDRRPLHAILLDNIGPAARGQ